MESKTEFKSVFKTPANCGRGVRRDVKNEIAYNINVSHSKNKKQYAAVFYIGINLIKKARFIDGDRIDILKSNDGKYGLLKRVPTGGRALSKKHAKNTGKISGIYNESLPWVNSITTLENVVIDDEGILFEWPASTTRG